MQRKTFSLLILLLAAASPALAEGFSQTQFVLLLFVNLVLGAVMTLFLAVLASALLAKLRPAKRVAPRVAVPKD